MTEDQETELSGFYETHENAMRNMMNLSTDWTMRDFPAMKEEFYQKLTEIIGEENYKFISGSSRNTKLITNEDGTKTSEKLPYNLVRATLFINQQGRENLRKYATEVK